MRIKQITQKSDLSTKRSNSLHHCSRCTLTPNFRNFIFITMGQMSVEKRRLHFFCKVCHLFQEYTIDTLYSTTYTQYYSAFWGRDVMHYDGTISILGENPVIYRYRLIQRNSVNCIVTNFIKQAEEEITWFLSVGRKLFS